MFYSLNERKATTFDRHSKKSLGIETSFGLIFSKYSDNIQLRKPPTIQNLAALQLCQKEVHHFSANLKTYFISYFPIKSDEGENSIVILTYWKFVDNKILSAFPLFVLSIFYSCKLILLGEKIQFNESLLAITKLLLNHLEKLRRNGTQ